MPTKTKKGKKVDAEKEVAVEPEAAADVAEAKPASLTQATAAVSKMDMVRITLQEGVTKPTEGVDFIKSRWGVEMPTTMFSAYKNNIQKKKVGGGSSGGRGRRQPSSAGEIIRGVKGLVDRYGAEVVRDVVTALTE